MILHRVRIIFLMMAKTFAKNIREEIDDVTTLNMNSKERIRNKRALSI